jgi:ribonuclease-3
MGDIANLSEDLQTRIGYRFNNLHLLDGALTHPSSGIAKGAAKLGAGYERLEFLGDRVLGLVIAELLLERFPADDEGALSKRSVALVRKEALLDVAREIEIGAAINLAPGAGRAYERHKETASADGVEALIGAIFRDGGYKAASGFVRHWWKPLLNRYEAPPKDPKTTLQEWAQARALKLPAYAVIGMNGPAHQPVFVVEAKLDTIGTERASGRSKRIAEQAAATVLLARAQETAAQ